MSTSPPLCVDLDGTLVRSDTLVEACLLLARRRPLTLLARLWTWLRHGRAAFKQAVVRDALPDVTLLPFNEPLLAHLRGERAAGRTLVLVTGADRCMAEAVAAHCPIFAEVLASDGAANLSGRAKRDLLVARYGEGGFDYAGNSATDLVVWRAARAALVVNAPARVEAAARAAGAIDRVFPRPARDLALLVRAVRLHQWVKNLLIFVPVFTAHVLAAAPFRDAALMFGAFSLLASSVYLLNDLLDLESDRRHPSKRDRPLASGRLPASTAAALIPLLLVGAAALVWPLPPSAAGVLLLYYLVTCAYSFQLKRKAVLDVLVLASLYSLRLLAGAVATGVELSEWLLAFSMFFFLSLAFLKRYTELLTVDGDRESGSGRGYEKGDLPLVGIMGVASGFISVLVLTLYASSAKVESLYRQPHFVWLLAPLVLYWLCRVWLEGYRGRMHDDPVLFALKDRRSLVVVAAAVACTLLAI